MKYTRKWFLLSLVSIALGVGFIYAGLSVAPRAVAISEADMKNLQWLVVIGGGLILLPLFLMFAAYIIGSRQSS